MSTPKFMIVFGLLLVLVTGCAAPAATEPPPSERVEVTMTDFAFSSTQSEFKVGQPYEFVITNAGAIPHEFRIIPPTHGDGDAHSGETHDQSLLTVTEDELPPGETVTVEFTFDEDQAGRDLEIACHIEGHYEADMRMPITVEE